MLRLGICQVPKVMCSQFFYLPKVISQVDRLALVDCDFLFKDSPIYQVDDTNLQVRELRSPFTWVYK